MIIGFYDGRVDQVACHLALLIKYASQAQFEVIGKNSHLYAVKRFQTLVGRKGDLVSLLTFDSRGVIVSTKGLKYKLSYKHLLPSSRGMSNEMSQKHASISVKNGTLFVFHYV